MILSVLVFFCLRAKDSPPWHLPQAEDCLVPFSLFEVCISKEFYPSQSPGHMFLGVGVGGKDSHVSEKMRLTLACPGRSEFCGG